MLVKLREREKQAAVEMRRSPRLSGGGAVTGKTMVSERVREPCLLEEQAACCGRGAQAKSGRQKAQLHEKGDVVTTGDWDQITKGLICPWGRA